MYFWKLSYLHLLLVSSLAAATHKWVSAAAARVSEWQTGGSGSSLAMGTRLWSPRAICTTAQERGPGSPAPLPASASSPVDGLEAEWTSDGPQGRATGGAVTAVVSCSLSFFKDQEPQGKTLRGCCKSGSGSRPPCFLSRLPQLSAQPEMGYLGCLALLHQWLRILSGMGTALFLCRSRVGILVRPGVLHQGPHMGRARPAAQASPTHAES